MEQHLADLQRAQRKKRAMADSRAIEKGDLQMPKADMGLPDEVHGTLAGTSVQGGAMGLERVVGAGGKKGRGKAGAGKAGAGKAGAGRLEIVHHEGEGMAGAGVVSDLRIPIISDIARLFGLGKKGKRQGRKAREDERLAMEIKGLKNKMAGGSYIDPAFGVINQPQGTSEAFEQVAGEGPMGSGYHGGAKAQGEKMAQYLKELHGEGYAKEFAGGFWGALASIAAPLIGKLISGNGKKGKKRGGMKLPPQAMPESMEEARAAAMADPAVRRPIARRPRQNLPSVLGFAAQPQAAQGPLMPNAAQAARRLGAPMPAAAGESAAAALPAPAAMPSAAALRVSPVGMLPGPGARAQAQQGVGLFAEIPRQRSPPSPEGSGKKKRGGAKPGDRRSARAAVVKRVMAEQGMSLPQASKYVKEHGLF